MALYKWLSYQFCILVLFVAIVISGSDNESESLDLELRLAPPISHQTSPNTAKQDDIKKTDKGPANKRKRYTVEVESQKRKRRSEANKRYRENIKQNPIAQQHFQERKSIQNKEYHAKMKKDCEKLAKRKESVKRNVRAFRERMKQMKNSKKLPKENQ